MTERQGCLHWSTVQTNKGHILRSDWEMGGSERARENVCERERERERERGKKGERKRREREERRERERKGEREERRERERVNETEGAHAHTRARARETHAHAHIPAMYTETDEDDGMLRCACQVLVYIRKHRTPAMMRSGSADHLRLSLRMYSRKQA